MFLSASMLGALVLVWAIASALDRTPLNTCTCCPPKPPRSWEDHPAWWLLVGPFAAGFVVIAYRLGWLG